uniref:Uncharacterized protein n=1 Tax=Leersia perrieri TaxID=77586 RepID=A0A0D9X5U8_9ORYZ
MAVTVAGSRKRGLANVVDSVFLDDQFSVPSHLAKRSRCSSSDTSVADLEKGKDIFPPNGSSINIPSNRSQWAELVVKEMSSALDLVDAKNRAFNILDLFQKATSEQCTSQDVLQKMREEHQEQKLTLGGLLEQNGFMKRAFLKQHNLLHDCKKTSQERLQIIDQYKKENEALKQRNMFLEFQLAQLNQHSHNTGQCNPNVF